MTDTHRIVFLCVANSARSQMAEGLARASAPVGWAVSSAGSDPGTLHPMAVRAMAEIGIDIRHHRSKGVEDVALATADAVVTLCAEEVCPTVPPNVKRIRWAMPDPAASGPSDDALLEAFRGARDGIVNRVAELWSQVEHGDGV